MEHAQAKSKDQRGPSLSKFIVPSYTRTDKNLLTERMFTHGQVDWIYFVAFAATAGGIVLYSYKYVSFHHHFSYGCIRHAYHMVLPFLLLRLRGTLVARRGSNEVEETAQVAGASDEHGKDRDEEAAGTQNPV